MFYHLYTTSNQKTNHISRLNYEETKHSLNLYKEKKKIFCLKPRFYSLEILKFDQKILLYYEVVRYLPHYLYEEADILKMLA